MFEQEMELEKKRGSGFGPLLIIVLLIGLAVGGLGYVLWQTNQVIKPEQATTYLTQVYKAKPPVTIQFHTGLITPSVYDPVSEPHYKLLSKAGILTLKPQGSKVQITLTANGEKTVNAVENVKKQKESDGSIIYTVPLATKELVKVEDIAKLSPGKVRVDYSWQWKPTEMGKSFDAAGPVVKSFGTYDRSVLIDKYGAAFYGGAPQKLSVVMVHSAKGWEPSID